MKDKLGVPVALGLCGLLAVVSFTFAAPKNQIPVTVTFRCPGATCTTLDRIMGDGGGPYVDGITVEAAIVGTGNLSFYTDALGPGERTLFLDFQDQVATTACQRPFAFDSVEAFMSTSNVQDLDGNAITNNLLGMAVGPRASAFANVNVNFSAVGLGWFIRFNPTFSGATLALVTRTSSETWDIEAAGDFETGKLLSYPTKGKFVLTDCGNFRMPFKATIRVK